MRDQPSGNGSIVPCPMYTLQHPVIMCLNVETQLDRNKDKKIETFHMLDAILEGQIEKNTFWLKFHFSQEIDMDTQSVQSLQHFKINCCRMTSVHHHS